MERRLDRALEAQPRNGLDPYEAADRVISELGLDG
jgi:hypothetical protein